jgi:hypothetical protein
VTGLNSPGHVVVAGFAAPLLAPGIMAPTTAATVEEAIKERTIFFFTLTPILMKIYL